MIQVSSPSVVLVLLVCGCSEPGPTPVAVAPTPGGEARPDIVLIVVDGVRKDVRSEEDQTAVLLNAIGQPPLAIFDSAYATSASVFNSFGSLLTGVYPAAIPICQPRTGASVEKGSRAWCTELPEARPTLPDVLAVYGYDTALFSTGGEGFDTFGDRFQTSVDVVAGTRGPRREEGHPELTATAAAWWADHKAHPRLLVAHITDVGEALLLPPVPAHHVPGTPPERRSTAPITTPGVMPTPAAQQAIRAQAKAIYTTAVASLGVQVTALSNALPAGSSGRYTVVLSLAGGALGEGTGFKAGGAASDGHQLLLERVLHVPLFIWGPAAQSGTPPLAAPVDPTDSAELTDVLPTLLARVAAVLPAGASGRDLLSGRADPTPWAYADFGDMLSIRQGAYRLTLRTYEHDTTSLDPTLTERASALNPTDWTLHQIDNDPLQATDLVRGALASDPLFTQLHNALVHVRTTVGAPPSDALTPEKLWALRMSAGQGYW